MGKETIGVLIFIISCIVVIFIVFTSYPKIEIDYYTKYNDYGTKEFIPTDFNISVNTKEAYSSSQICFRFKNTAEPLLQYVIPASNFKVYINTNAECEACNVFTSLETLQAQNTGDVCKNIKTSKNLSYLTMNVDAKWQALSLEKDTRANYMCQKVGEEGGRIIYFCKLLS